MEELLEQFEILKNKCTELLENNAALQFELYKTKQTNKLLEEKNREERKEEIGIKENSQSQVDKKKSGLNKNEIEGYIKEIDDCLEILKTMK